MTMPIVIRPAVPDDAPVISAIGLAIHDLHFGAVPGIFQVPDTSVWPPADVVTLLAKAGHSVTVATREHQVVGYSHTELQEVPATSLTRARRRLYLRQLGVDTSHRRQGIGTALLHAVLASAKAHSVDDVMLHVYGFNKDAQDFYKAHGFTLFSEHLWLQASPNPTS